MFFFWEIDTPMKDNDAALANTARIKFVRSSWRIDKRKSVLMSTAEGTLARTFPEGREERVRATGGAWYWHRDSFKYKIQTTHFRRLVFSNVTIRDKFGSELTRTYSCSRSPGHRLILLETTTDYWQISAPNLFPSWSISGVAHATTYNSQYRLIACAAVIRGARTLHCTLAKIMCLDR